jgi:hypothetical protein
MSGEKVVPIDRAARPRATTPSLEATAGFEELAREVVGPHTFVAERKRVRGKMAWRIRVEGTAEVIDFSDPITHRETFASFVGAEPMLLDDWLAARASLHKHPPGHL